MTAACGGQHPGAPSWLDSTMRAAAFIHTLDTTLSSDFLAIVGSRLGACRFCGKTLDCKGRHASSCMAGGDHVTLLSSVRAASAG